MSSEDTGRKRKAVVKPVWPFRQCCVLGCPTYTPSPRAKYCPDCFKVQAAVANKTRKVRRGGSPKARGVLGNNGNTIDTAKPDHNGYTKAPGVLGNIGDAEKRKAAFRQPVKDRIEREQHWAATPVLPLQDENEAPSKNQEVVTVGEARKKLQSWAYHNVKKEKNYAVWASAHPDCDEWQRQRNAARRWLRQMQVGELQPRLNEVMHDRRSKTYIVVRNPDEKRDFLEKKLNNGKRSKSRH